MKTGPFNIAPLRVEDVLNLNELMVSNAERFKRFFPKTLSSNLTFEATKSYILDKTNEFQLKSGFTFAIKQKANHNIIGLVILKKLNWKLKQAEIAYCISSEFEGKGLTSFSVKEITRFAFEDLGLKTLQIISHKTNFGSVQVAKNCGFVWQRTLPKEFTPINEVPLDMELYELYNEK
jgi:ribosomal-protein-alanine N-acetyltransferase